MTQQMDLKNVVAKIREYQATTNLNGEQLRLELIDKNLVKVIGDEKKAYNLLLCASKSDKEYIDLLCDMIPSMDSNRGNFKDERPNGYDMLIKALMMSLNSISEGKESEEKESNPKLKYIKQLYKRGFKLVTDDDVIANNNALHSTMLAIFKSVYKAQPVIAMKLPDRCNLTNKRLLESLGLKPSTADIWDELVYTKDEDLAFRLFIKEDNTSYTVILKLPIGVNNFNLIDKYGNINPLLEAIPDVLGQSTYLDNPKILNMKNTQKVDCPYDCIKFILVKDLLAFKEDDWLLRDYIQQARGTRTDTKYSVFEELPLGERIVAGVYPGGLQSQKFICTKDISAGFLCGGAGSGKTAMYDSILVQSLAHCGDAGDGALILLDAKKEWVGVWIDLFKKRGIQLYGFDGEVLPADELKMESVNKKGETEVIKVPFEVLRCTAGAIFIDGMYNLIQNMLQGTSSKYDNILEFNEAKANFNGLTRIPRITILLDEINTMHGYLKSSTETQRIFKEGFIRAKLTRTSGFIWFLGGQDISKSIVASDERSNYKYSIVGSLDASRYPYYDVNVNKAIVNYEERNGTADKPYPIMSQGVFYAGSKGRTSVVKCMYLPSKQRSEALDDLKMDFIGMKQLDALVKYALKEGIFDKYNSLVGAKNNIVYSALKSIGAITQDEFDYYTDRVFNGVSDESASALSDFNDVDIDNIDIDDADVTPKVEPPKPVPSNPSSYWDNVGVESLGDRAGVEDVYTDDSSKGVDTSDLVKGAMVGAGAYATADMLDDAFEDMRGNKGSTKGGNVIQFPNKNSNVGDYQEGSAVPETVEDYSEDMGIEDMRGSANTVANDNVDSYGIPKNDPVYQEPVKSPNTFEGCEVYGEELDCKGLNPFDSRASKTIFGGIDAFKYMNKIVEQEIKKAFHGFDRIKSMQVSDNGLFVNGIAFRPKLPANMLDSLPIDIRGEVSRGNIVEFLDFHILFKLPNIDTFIVDNVRLAETRVRKDLGMKRDMTWDLLYDNFPSLQCLVIGGSKITTPEEAAKYKEDGPGASYDFQERIRDAFSLDVDLLERVKSPVSKMWRSKPVTIITGAMGGVIGTKVVLGIASLMGGWGFLFAGLAGLGAYNTYGRGRYGTRGGNRSSYHSNSRGGYDDYDDYGGGYEDVRGSRGKSRGKSSRRR